MRTAKAERRAQSREKETREDDQLSPADKRRAEAEKKAAWRQARLKSLENVCKESISTFVSPSLFVEHMNIMCISCISVFIYAQK